MINTYVFLQLKFSYGTAKSCQVNWRTERTKACDLVFLCKDKTLKRGSKLLSYEMELRNWVIKNNVTLRVTHSEIFVGIVLSSY